MDLYDRFVGSITPEQFVVGFSDRPDPIQAAIDNLLKKWPWPDAPTQIEAMIYGAIIYEYVASKLGTA